MLVESISFQVISFFLPDELGFLRYLDSNIHVLSPSQKECKMAFDWQALIDR